MTTLALLEHQIAYRLAWIAEATEEVVKRGMSADAAPTYCENLYHIHGRTKPKVAIRKDLAEL